MAEMTNGGSQIDLETALALVRAFRTINPQSVKAHLVSAANLQQIMDQEGCTAVRIYQGWDEASQSLSPVLVGVDSQGEDMTDGVLIDRLVPCPPICGKSSVLLT